MSMNGRLENVYEEILAIIKSGRLGVAQVCVCSVNVEERKEDLLWRAERELALITAIFDDIAVDKETCKWIEKPYLHGFITREYDNGCIARCTYTAAPITNDTAFTVYGTKGELRYDTASGKITLFEQKPDCEGKEYY